MKISFLLALLPGFATLSGAQCMAGETTCSQKIPRLVTFNGSLRDVDGQPRTGTVGITFAIYTAASGGQRLWQETQNVQLDQQGHYEAMLGAMSQGIPLDLFSSGEPRWLGVQAQLPNEEEQPRVLMVSVPYALKAADAETLGGLPASAFLRANANPRSVQASGATWLFLRRRCPWEPTEFLVRLGLHREREPTRSRNSPALGRWPTPRSPTPMA